MVDGHPATNGNGSRRPFFSGVITLGSLIAALPAILALITLVVFVNNLGNKNDNQDNELVRLQNSLTSLTQQMFTEDEARAIREKRDSEIAGILRVQEADRASYSQSLGMASSRLDRVFEKLDALETAVTELKTTIQIMNRQARTGFDRGGGPATR